MTKSQDNPVLDRLVDSARRAWAPPPDLTIWEWADTERIVSTGPEAGTRWRTERVPYAREIMETVTDADVETVVCMTAAQVGKSSILENVFGYYIHQDPSPILMVHPTLEMAETYSKERLAPLLRETPALAARVADARTRDSGNTLRHKTFPGGYLVLAGANSPASLSARSVRILLCDEVDRYKDSAGTEGDPIAIAEARTDTFWNRKKIFVSTPTTAGDSRIEMAWEESDQRRYEVPCPHCGVFQVISWASIRWDTTGPDPGDLQRVRMVCQACQEDIDETEKADMLAAGCWAPQKPFRGTAGFHLSQLVSPWRPWQEIAVSFRKAKKDRETHRVWVNTVLGELWSEPGEAIDETSLFARRVQYAAQVPQGALVLTAGVDVQDDRLEMEVVGWGPGEESWGIDYRVLYGDPAQPELWRTLWGALQATYDHEDGYPLRIVSACIDSGGHFTQQVYRFCRGKLAARIFATKGMSGSGRPIVSSPAKKRTGRGRRPVELFLLGTHEAKRILHARLRLADRGPGYCHFPIHPRYGDEYFGQLTAERLVTRYHRGYKLQIWEKPANRRNEALDCRVLAYAGLHLLNPSWPDLERRAATIRDQKKAGEEGQEESAATAPVPGPPPSSPEERVRRTNLPRRPRRGWVQGWR